MDGCDVPEGKTGRCGKETYMGWQPLTESRGRKVCEYHWNRHKDPADSFNLWDAFGFRKPAGMNKPVPKKDVPRHISEPDPRRTVCMESAAKPELPREKPNRRKPEKPGPQTVPATEKPSGCKACGAKREAGKTYCQSCARERKAQSNRKRQKRHYQKVQKPNAFAPESPTPYPRDSLQGEIVGPA